MPALVFLCRTVGGRGVCVAQTCTDARSAGKAAHVGTTRPRRGANGCADVRFWLVP